MSDPIVEAIHDLTRVVIAVNGNFQSKSDAVRRLLALSIPPSRIAAILAMPLKDITSQIAKDKKKGSKNG